MFVRRGHRVQGSGSQGAAVTSRRNVCQPTPPVQAVPSSAHPRWPPAPRIGQWRAPWLVLLLTDRVPHPAAVRACARSAPPAVPVSKGSKKGGFSLCHERRGASPHDTPLCAHFVVARPSWAGLRRAPLPSSAHPQGCTPRGPLFLVALQVHDAGPAMPALPGAARPSIVYLHPPACASITWRRPLGRLSARGWRPLSLLPLTAPRPARVTPRSRVPPPGQLQPATALSLPHPRGRQVLGRGVGAGAALGSCRYRLSRGCTTVPQQARVCWSMGDGWGEYGER